LSHVSINKARKMAMMLFPKIEKKKTLVGMDLSFIG
jgi:hypothetical protein